MDHLKTTLLKEMILGIIIILSVSCNKESGNNAPEVPAVPSLDTFAEGLVQPLGIVTAGDSRLFVVEQEGTIAVIDSAGNLFPEKFLDISDKIVSGGEQGLLGLAFHPDYKSNGWFYVNYTGENDSTHISRFTVSGNNHNQADPASEVSVLTIAQPYTNHNGGDLKFGSDGYLYIGMGDGGSAGDPQNRAQNRNTMLGKILRIDVNSGSNYSIPPDNPFINDPGSVPEIWAYGLRNPWRFSFDRLTGDLWIADVGQNNLEEINMEAAGSPGGENYGWRCYEGRDEYNMEDCGPAELYVFPVHEYPHRTTECSVTGGYVFRGNEGSDYYGRYFFADYCSDKIWTLQNIDGTWVEELLGEFPGNSFSSFGEDLNGGLYLAGHTSGRVYRLNLP